MLYATLIFAVLATVLLSIGYYRGEGQHIAGLKAGFMILIQILPLLMLAFIVAANCHDCKMMTGKPYSQPT